MIKLFTENWAIRYINYLTTWRQHRQTIKELNMLTDKQLQDIGLNRHNISQLIWLKEDKIKKGLKK